MTIHPFFSSVSSWVFNQGDCHNLLYYLLFHREGAWWLGIFVCGFCCVVVFSFSQEKKMQLFLEYRPAMSGTLQATNIPQTQAGSNVLNNST